jgi:hypothetical protein
MSIAELKRTFQLFFENGNNKECEKQLIQFKQSDCWNLCQQILSEPFDKKNINLYKFCASCCYEYVLRRWEGLTSNAKIEPRNFLYNYAVSRISGQNCVPLILFNDILRILVAIITIDWPEVDSSLFDRLLDMLNKSCPSFFKSSFTSIDINELFGSPELIFVALSILSGLLIEVTDHKNSTVKSGKRDQIQFLLLKGDFSIYFNQFLEFLNLVLVSYYTQLKNSKTASPSHTFVPPFTSPIPSPSTHMQILTTIFNILKNSVRLINPFTSFNTSLPKVIQSALPFVTYTSTIMNPTSSGKYPIDWLVGIVT